MSIADRIRKIEERRAQVAERCAHRLDGTARTVRVIQLAFVADRLDPKAPHGRRARRVADLMQIALTRYVCEHGDVPKATRLAPPPAPTTPTPFDITAEIERQAQRNEHAQFDRLSARPTDPLTHH